MALLTPLFTLAPIADPDAIRGFLAARGITFEAWAVPEAAAAIAAQARLTDEDKAKIIAIFSDKLAEKASGAGYKSADVVAIRRDMPQVDEALGKFDKVHYHDDDEVRAIVGGSGIFGFVGDDGRQFVLRVDAGEYISVPAGAWHWFYCDDAKNVTAIRLFKDQPAWVAHYRSTERGVTAPT
ncbi:MAG: cupin domain-containing protein [Deltaproteobacteria bacterium]|nr:cupin domain-containing protein [Deltaproteobacteria bacterium]